MTERRAKPDRRPYLAARVTWLRHYFTSSRPRLLSATLLGAALYAINPEGARTSIRLVAAWDAGTLCFLGLVAMMMGRATQQSIRVRAQREDENAWVILAIMVGAALASMIAIFFLLQNAKGSGSAESLGNAVKAALAGITILLSWLLCHTMFALHYAHAYYDDIVADSAARPDSKHPIIAGGLAFPSEERPDYWDFLYFSLVVGMTCQVSDVQVTSRAMRRLTLAHGVVSFFFNTVILALSINIAAGLL